MFTPHLAVNLNHQYFFLHLKMPAVPLVAQGDDDKLIVCDEGLSKLKSLTGESVRVICIAGLYRSGKSTFLNHLLRRDGVADSFEVGLTTNSCTRGVWMYVSGDTVYLDSEGLASIDQDETYDCKIFTIGLLLSSFFVYNTVGVIDESALDRLHTVGQLAQQIASDGKGDLIDFKLMWLLRDFSLSLGSESPIEYLERALRDNPKKKNNEHRKGLRGAFPHRQCVTLVRPVSDEVQLQRVNEMELAELRPEFVAQLDAAAEAIQNGTEAKRVNGQVLNGPLLGQFLVSCVDGINEGGVPDIKKSFEYIAEQSHMDALLRAQEIYKGFVYNDGSTCSWKELVGKHESGRKKSIEVFNGVGVLRSSSKGKYVLQLEEYIKEAFDQAWRHLDADSWTYSKRIVDEILKRSQLEDVLTLLQAPHVECGPNFDAQVKDAVIVQVVNGKLLPQLQQALANVERFRGDLALAQKHEVELLERISRLERDVDSSLETNKELKNQNLELQDSVKTANESLEQQKTETMTAMSRLELEYKTRLQVESDLKSCRIDNQEIIELAGVQQLNFDGALVEMEDERDAFEVKLTVERMLKEVENRKVQKDLKRVVEERQALHIKLQDFFMRASTLPEFYQAQVFCSEHGLIDNW